MGSLSNLRPSLPLLRTLAALRLLARKDNVGVISRSTILLSHGLSARLRSASREKKKTFIRVSFAINLKDASCTDVRS